MIFAFLGPDICLRSFEKIILIAAPFLELSGKDGPIPIKIMLQTAPTLFIIRLLFWKGLEVHLMSDRSIEIDRLAQPRLASSELFFPSLRLQGLLPR